MDTIALTSTPPPRLLRTADSLLDEDLWTGGMATATCFFSGVLAAPRYSREVGACSAFCWIFAEELLTPMNPAAAIADAICSLETEYRSFGVRVLAGPGC